jgi:hypothetical protein
MPKTSIALAITVAACVGMWAYMLRVANPNIRLPAVITGDRAGDLGDLYPRWHGTRQLILFGPEPPWPRCERRIAAGILWTYRGRWAARWAAR